VRVGYPSGFEKAFFSHTTVQNMGLARQAVLREKPVPPRKTRGNAERIDPFRRAPSPRRFYSVQNFDGNFFPLPLGKGLDKRADFLGYPALPADYLAHIAFGDAKLKNDFPVLLLALLYNDSVGIVDEAFRIYKAAALS
jgi:hypothetical protein